MRRLRLPGLVGAAIAAAMFATGAQADTSFYGPALFGIATAPDGHLYVADGS